MDALCPVHQVPFITKPAGVSRKTGRPYNAFQVCPTFGCNEKPARLDGQPTQFSGGWPAVREQAARAVAPEKAVMTKEDWERKEERTNRNILLQVAFKAAVEIYAISPNKPAQSGVEFIKQETLLWHSWLLSQMTHENPVQGQILKPSVPVTTPPADLVEKANREIADAVAEEVGF